MSDRERHAINNVRAFSVFVVDKLPPHVAEDLRIVTALAEQALNMPAPKPYSETD